MQCPVSFSSASLSNTPNAWMGYFVVCLFCLTTKELVLVSVPIQIGPVSRKYLGKYGARTRGLADANYYT